MNNFIDFIYSSTLTQLCFLNKSDGNRNIDKINKLQSQIH